MQYLVYRYNYQEVEKARAMAKELGVIIRFAQIGGVEWNEGLRDEWLAPDEKWISADPDCSGLGAESPYHRFWLCRGIVVNSNGEVARCPGYQNITTLGAMGEGEVMDIYNEPKSQRSRQLFQKGPVPEGDFSKPCNSCNYYQREHGCSTATKENPAFNRKLVKAGASRKQTVPE